MDTIARVRRVFCVQRWPVKKILRQLHVSRLEAIAPLVRAMAVGSARSCGLTRRTSATSAGVSRFRGSDRGKINQAGLAANAGKPSRERLTLMLRALGYEGGYDAVRRFARNGSQSRGTAAAEAGVPLSCEPGEAYQFDWSQEVVLVSGVTVTVKLAHVRLCHSRMMFARAYPRAGSLSHRA